MSNNNDYTSSNNVSRAAQPLQLFQPFNFIVFLSFYSPVILAVSVVSLSFIFQNFKGFIYLGFLLACCVIREFIYKWSGSNPSTSDGTICTSIQYSKYGNPAFSAFVFAFTIMYFAYPMFSNDSVNIPTIISLIVYSLIDMFIKIYNSCIKNTGDLFLNVMAGLTSAAIFVAMMYAGGSGKYLFFNEVSSNKEICSQPKKQTFKCSLYRNGELISGIN